MGIPVEDRAGIPDRLPFEVELVPDQRDGYMWPVARLKGSDWVTGAAPSEVFKAAAPVSDMTGAASETLPKVVECIAKAFGVDAAGIGAETKMVEDLNASSLHLFSLASMLEDEVGKVVAYADIAPLATVGDIAAFLD